MALWFLGQQQLALLELPGQLRLQRLLRLAMLLASRIGRYKKSMGQGWCHRLPETLGLELVGQRLAGACSSVSFLCRPETK